MTEATLSTFHAGDYLQDDETRALYLQQVMEYGDPKAIQLALKEIARSKGMSAVASEVGVSRESLYRSLSEDGNPSWKTVFGIIKSLGLRLNITPA